MARTARPRSTPFGVADRDLSVPAYMMRVAGPDTSTPSRVPRIPPVVVTGHDPRDPRVRGAVGRCDIGFHGGHGRGRGRFRRRDARAPMTVRARENR